MGSPSCAAAHRGRFTPRTEPTTPSRHHRTPDRHRGGVLAAIAIRPRRRRGTSWLGGSAQHLVDAAPDVLLHLGGDRRLVPLLDDADQPTVQRRVPFRVVPYRLVLP